HAFLYYAYADHLDLHSFPTRRSSDLEGGQLAFEKTAAQKDSHGACSLGRSARQSSIESVLQTRCQRGLKADACRRQSWRDSPARSEEHTSELQSRENLVCRLLLEKKKSSARSGERPCPGGSCHRRKAAGASHSRGGSCR